MGVPVVGKRHHGEANTSQGAVGVFGTIPKRISGVRSGGRSSVNNQQSIQAQEPAENNRQCVMSAVFSHAVRWEFCGHNPISSGIPVGTGGQRGPSTGVRVSAKRQEVSFSLVTRRSQTRSSRTGISRPDSRVSGRCLRNTTRRTWGTALVRLQFRQHELQCPSFVLLASRRTPEEHQNRSICQVVADACESEARFAGMEITKSLQPADGLRLPFRKAERKQTTRLGLGVEEEDPTGIQEDRHPGSGLAHFSARGGIHACRDGRTPTHDPGLLASCESARNQQVSAGNNNEQALGTRKAGGCHSARGCAIGKQVNSGPLGSQRPIVQANRSEKEEYGAC